jgi:peptide-methionine (R)-S-oxide reductase
MSIISRRRLLVGGSSLAVLAAAGGLSLIATRGRAAEGSFEVEHTEEEWRAMLTPDQFSVLRQEGTERPFSSPLNDEHGAGVFHCAGCDLPLFSSETKYDSGTGWPSFWAPIENAVGTSEDTSLFMTRVEVHCSRCGGHLGHVFDDGPEPTGKRYCMNGVAMTFAAGESAPA